jgi:hypothetical protein
VRPRAGLLIVVLGLLAIALVALVVLLQSAQRRAGTNLTTDTGLVVHVPAGESVCEPGEIVPKDTGALGLGAGTGTHPGPELDVTIGGPTGPLTSGRLAAGWRSGVIRIPLKRVRETVVGATVCVSNRGSSQVDFGGSVPSGFAIDIAGKTLLGRLRIEYMRPGSETWLQFAPVLAHRFSLAKSDLLRHWEVFAVLLLMLLTIGVAARTIVAEERSS